jgi:hypothetical protein
VVTSAEGMNEARRERPAQVLPLVNL